MLSKKQENIMTTIGEDIINKSNFPFWNYGDIPGEVPYDGSSSIHKFNCHNGQRKLFLNEVQFYTSYVRDPSAIVIYAGSAHGEHTPMILDMFPNIKLLLIDPNYHSIDHDYDYVYQNPDVVSKENHQEFINYLKYNGNHKRMNKLKDGAKRLINVPMLFKPDERGNMINSVKSAISKVPLDNDGNLSMIMDCYDGFYKGDYLNLFETMKKSDKRIFIIQDYLTNELCQKLRQGLDDNDVYLVTDIRTSIDVYGIPSDLDVLWNACLQMIFVDILKPKYSMLKFHPPYFDSYGQKMVEQFNKSDKYSIKKDFDYVKKRYGIDVIKMYLNDRQYTYFKGEQIWIQPWAPKSSSEARLIVSRKNMNKMMLYDPVEWENRFAYLNYYRSYAYHDIFYKHIRKYQDDPNVYLDYDGSYDSTLEIIIFSQYIMDLSPSKLTLKVIERALTNYDFIKQLNHVYYHLNKTIFYTLRSNVKCPFLGLITAPPKNLNFYVCTSKKNKEKINFDVYQVDSKKKIEKVNGISAVVETQYHKGKGRSKKIKIKVDRGKMDQLPLANNITITEVDQRKYPGYQINDSPYNILVIDKIKH